MNAKRTIQSQLAGFDHRLTKPVELERLAALLEKAAQTSVSRRVRPTAEFSPWTVRSTNPAL
jgi:hypothetical protein